jgi:hypothetical protein
MYASHSKTHGTQSPLFDTTTATTATTTTTTTNTPMIQPPAPGTRAESKEALDDREALNAREVLYEACDWDQIDGSAENNKPRVRKRKMEILRRLQRRYNGPQGLAARGLSMSTPLIELEYEDEHDADDDAEGDAIASAKDWAKIIFSLIEKGNQRFGPVLNLKDWADHMAAEIERFDRPFRRIYRMYFSKRQTSPGWEIAWIVIGSALMFHCTGKLVGERNIIAPRSHVGANQEERRAGGGGSWFDVREEDELPPPPVGIGGGRSQAGSTTPYAATPDLSALLGGLLGGNGAPGGLNIGNILGMLGSAASP